MKNKTDELLFMFLPSSLQERYNIDNMESTPDGLLITLREIETLPSFLPAQYHGKKILTSTVKSTTVEDFPVRGRRCTLILKRGLMDKIG
jgi:hypothetical protein